LTVSERSVPALGARRHWKGQTLVLSAAAGCDGLGLIAGAATCEFRPCRIYLFGSRARRERDAERGLLPKIRAM
jgi:hypothetical protein